LFCRIELGGRIEPRAKSYLLKQPEKFSEFWADFQTSKNLFQWFQLSSHKTIIKNIYGFQINQNMN
jgi:hypothetical protein